MLCKGCKGLTEGEVCPAFVFPHCQGTLPALEEYPVVFFQQRKVQPQEKGSVVLCQKLRVEESE